MADLNQEPLGEYKGVPYYASGSGLRCRLGGISTEYPSLPKLNQPEHMQQSSHRVWVAKPTQTTRANE